MKRERGMVTVELAWASLVVAAAVALGAWLLAQLVTYDLCQVTANEVARQAARGDRAAVERATADRPAGSTVEVASAGGATTVTVRFAPVLLGLPVGPFATTVSVLEEAQP